MNENHQNHIVNSISVLNNFPIDDFLKISADLRKALNVDLIGFDILIDENKHYWIIDVNYFPSYRGVKDLWPKLLHFFLEKLGLPMR